MKVEKIIIQKITFFIVLTFAILIRFLNLGNLPLSDFEAKLALNSLHILSGNDAYFTSDVFLTNINAVLIYLFGDSNLVVRLFSAFVGTLLVFTPFLFRKVVDNKLLFIISLWLAIDPVLVSLSRQINSSLLCVLFGVLLIYFILKKDEIATGIFSSLLLLCGKSVWFGFFPLMVLFVYRMFRNSKTKDNENGISTFLDQFRAKRYFISLAVSLVLLSTFGFIFRSQFVGVIQGLLDYFQGWGSSSAVKVMDLFRAIFIYEFPVIFLGLLGIILFSRSINKYYSLLAVWLFLSIIHLLTYPSVSIANSVWLVIPFIIFGSLFIRKYALDPGQNRKIIGLISGIGFVLMEFLTLISINLMTNSATLTQSPVSKTIMVIAGVVLVLFAIFLIVWSLSWKIAGKSLLFIFLVYFGIYTLSAGWNGAGLRSPYENDMLHLNPIPISEKILVSTIENYSEWTHGSKHEAEIQVINIDYPSLNWALRNFENIEFVNHFSTSANPEFVITKFDQTIEAADSYKGQDFEWIATPIWNLLIPNEWANWVLSRRIPTNLQQQDLIILWVRNDLFPGN